MITSEIFQKPIVQLRFLPTGVIWPTGRMLDYDFSFLILKTKEKCHTDSFYILLK
jgi:hypothetical protein